MINFKQIKYLLSTAFTLMLLSFVLSSCSKDVGDEFDTGKVDGGVDTGKVDEVGSLGVVKDFSNSDISGVDIQEFSVENNAMIIKTTKDKLPEKGEYLVSGITDAAPLGFLVKTVEVSSIGGDSYVVITEPATLGEVLRAKGIKFQGWITPESEQKTRGIKII